MPDTPYDHTCIFHCSKIGLSMTEGACGLTRMSGGGILAASLTASSFLGISYCLIYNGSYGG